MNALLIAEKPSLRRTIESVYKKHEAEIPYDITFIEQRGHLLTLKNPVEIDEDLMKDWCWENIPFHPEEHGGWSYKIINEKSEGNYLTSKDRYEAIKKEIESGNYDFIINAGDPDQEGQLLIWETLSSLKIDIPVKRFWSNDLTEGKILNALTHLRDDQEDPMLVNLLQAGYARQHSDYRFGMNITRAATVKLHKKASCGRVKTPIMSIVCKREQDIANFKPETVYGLKANYEEGFSGTLCEYEGDNGREDDRDENDESNGILWYKSREEVVDMASNLSENARITKYETKKTETYAPKLFKLSTAQVAAGKYGYSASQVLEIIQSLYEKGFMSYPRTDCEFISSNENIGAMLHSLEAVPALKDVVDQVDRGVFKKVLSTKKWVNDKKLTESGHSALVPTSNSPVWNDLTEDEKKIYEMVGRQFLAIFYPPLVQNKTLLISEIDGYTFRSTGKTLIDPGYTVLFGTTFTDVEIPEFEEYDRLCVRDYEVTEKTSTCPKRFTDADLIAACEAPHKYLEDQSLKRLGKKLKIGTPATRASIIDELILRNKYLQRKKEGKTEYIVPTEVGMFLYENLKDCAICKVDMTGEWEEKLEMIRNGELELKDIETEMMRSVEDMIREIKEMEITVVLPEQERKVICKCPECGGDVISGPKSFYCSNWKEQECKFGLFKEIMGAKITDKDFEALLKGQSIKKKLKSKKGTIWEQELVFNQEEHKLDFVKKESESSDPIETDYVCPNCGETLTDKGNLIVCDCGFTLWKSVCGKRLTEDEIDRFFETGDTGLVTGLTSKAGKKFSAHLVLNEDKMGTKMEFEKK